MGLLPILKCVPVKVKAERFASLQIVRKKSTYQ